MFCTHCGAKLAENGKFCSICGTAAQPAVQPVAPSAAQPSSSQPVYGTPVYSYPVYVMPAPAAQPAPQSAPAAAAAPYAAPVSAAGSIPAYRRPSPAAAPAAPAPSAAVSAAADPDADEPLEFVEEPAAEDTASPLTVWQTIVCLLALFCLPIGNIVFATVWGFRLGEHPQRRTLARAALPFIAVGLVALFSGLLWLVLNMQTISISFR